MIHAFLEAKKTDSSISCGYNTTVTFEEQHIYTPNYPENYPNDTTCVWLIAVPGFLEFNVTTYVRFTISGELEYNYDFLKINLLKNSSIMNSEIFTQEYDNLTYDIPVLKGTAEVLFISDNTVSFRGYHIKFKLITREGNIQLF